MNAQNLSYRLKVNELVDLTTCEVVSRYTGYKLNHEFMDNGFAVTEKKAVCSDARYSYATTFVHAGSLESSSPSP